MKRGILHRAAGCLAALLMLQALVLSGVSITRTLHASVTDEKTCLVSFDVCGHGAPGASVQNFEMPAAIPCAADFYFPSISSYPPMPDMAVATADAGETEKPPEA